MKIRIAPFAKCLMAGTAGGLMLAQFCGLGFSEADAQQPSSIQEELQKLYESEGRTAPNMSLQSLPNSTPDGRVFEAIPASELPPEPEPVAQTPKRKLLDKLFWWKRSAPVTPRVRVVPQNNSAPRTPQQSNVRSAPAPQFQPGVRPNFQRPQQPPATNVYQPSVPQQPRVYQQPRPLPDDPRLQVAPSYSGQVPVRSASQPRPIPMNTTSPQHPLALPPAPPAEIRENVPSASPFPAETKPTADLPDLDALPDEPLPLVPEEPKVPDQAKPPVDELFPDPFTELSEEAADRNRQTDDIPQLQVKPVTPSTDVPKTQTTAPSTTEQLPVVKPRTQPQVPQAKPFPDSVEDAQESTTIPSEDENPFSGLKLDPGLPAESKLPAKQDQSAVESATDEVNTDDNPLDAEAAEENADPLEATIPDLPADDAENSKSESNGNSSSIPDVDTAIEDEFNLPGTRETSEAPLPGMPKLEKIPIGEGEGEQGNFSWEEEQARQAAKLKLIAARKGETGLKGFCIVALRDDRDLKDALPQFRSTYNLRTYHFSNLESKIEFDKDPKKYVPAYDGNDPVLLSTESEEREGSLDMGLWFKGRLYLFVDQENMQAFENDPVLYAEN